MNEVRTHSIGDLEAMGELLQHEERAKRGARRG